MKTKSLLMVGLVALFLVACIREQPQRQPQVEETPIMPSTNPALDGLAQDAAEYRSMEPFRIDNLNSLIKEKGLKTDTDIMQAYTPKNGNPLGNYTYDVNTEMLNDNRKEITLISENFQDPSIYGLKVILTLEKDNGDWKVTNIRESYKCQVNRGQQDWASTLCN